MKIFAREVVISMILSLFFVFILSIIMSATTASEKIIMPGVIVSSSISLMIGAFRVSKCKKEKGILNGAILGFCYMFALYIISSFISIDFSLTINSIIMILCGILCGIIGGIIGVNF